MSKNCETRTLFKSCTSTSTYLNKNMQRMQILKVLYKVLNTESDEVYHLQSNIKLRWFQAEKLLLRWYSMKTLKLLLFWNTLTRQCDFKHLCMCTIFFYLLSLLLLCLLREHVSKYFYKQQFVSLIKLSEAQSQTGRPVFD